MSETTAGRAAGGIGNYLDERTGAAGAHQATA